MIRRILYAVATLVVIGVLFFSPSIAECTLASTDNAPASPGLLLPPAVPSEVRVSILKTGHTSAPEVFTYACGSLFRRVGINHMAVLIEHPQGNMLFDTGLGRNVDAQVASDMAWWAKLLFRYEKDTPARDQLDAAGIAPPRFIALSHAHWDHASALVDFQESEVLIATSEKTFMATPNRAVLPSQISSNTIRWREVAFENKPYAGFAQSADVYGDGTAILVPLFGHTPGSLGLFLTTSAGKRYLFVGDAVWRRAALQTARPKFWMMGAIVDNDAEATDAMLHKIAAVIKANPDLAIVPAHDAEAHDEIGYLPNRTP
jgi:glyoxylase-like metal-dependent hydrolase (beta-lactamase superfamily II)